MHGHQPRYTGYAEEAEIDVDGCCCPNDAGNEILFRINW